MPVISCTTNHVSIVPSNNNIHVVRSSGLLSTPVKEIYSYDNITLFPVEGVIDNIYISTDDNILYRWDGVTYVSIGGGNTSSGLFITDVTNSGSGIIGDKNYQPDTIPHNRVILNALSDDDSATIHFIAEGGINYSPIITLNGIPCDNLTEIAGDIRLFSGSFDVVVPTSTIFILEHSDGGESSVVINRAPAGPEIINVKYVDGYPNTQTEVKHGDVYHVELTFDPNSTEPVEVFVHNYGSTTGGMVSLAGTELDWGNIHTATIQIIIKSTSNVVTNLPCRVQGRNSFGTFGNIMDTDHNGVVDGINLIACNDIEPSFTFNNIIYPASQLAFKNNEAGNVSVSVHDFSNAAYNSPNNDFTVDNPNVYAELKGITCNHPMNYNDSIVNYRITATRDENGTSNVFNIVVEVADTYPVINITQPYSRMRSSVGGTSYIITATSNQNISTIIDMEVDIPVSGTWDGIGWNGTAKIKTRNIIINDNDIKGTGNWTFGTTPVNNAGISAHITGIENVGGFVARTLTIDAWGNREVNLGTDVVDVGKLVCENLSKGGNAPHGGTIFTYKNNTGNELDKYTITNNDTWYNCDQPNASSNTTGTAQIIIEEMV